MTDTAVIENKISSVRKYLKMAAAYRKYPQKTIEKDMTLKAAVERYLYLLTQSVIDLAEAVIAFKKFRKPSTYAEAFDILCEEGLINPALAGKMVSMAGFRNVIAHDYEKLDFDIVYNVLVERVKDIETFVKKIGGAL